MTQQTEIQLTYHHRGLLRGPWLVPKVLYTRFEPTAVMSSNEEYPLNDLRTTHSIWKIMEKGLISLGDFFKDTVLLRDSDGISPSFAIVRMLF